MNPTTSYRRSSRDPFPRTLLYKTRIKFYRNKMGVQTDYETHILRFNFSQTSVLRTTEGVRSNDNSSDFGSGLTEGTRNIP